MDITGKPTPVASDEAYAFSDQVGYFLRRAYQRHLAIFQANACDPQLTAVQFSTLCALRDHGLQSQGQLVRVTGVDQGTIRGIVARLNERGLITQQKDETDARKVIIGITPAGSDLLERMIPCARRTTEMTMEMLNPAERMALLYTLRQIARLDESD